MMPKPNQMIAKIGRGQHARHDQMLGEIGEDQQEAPPGGEAPADQGRPRAAFGEMADIGDVVGGWVAAPGSFAFSKQL